MTDRIVAKWPVSVDDRPHPIGGGEVVHVGIQHPGDIDTVTVWTIEPRTGAQPKRVVQIFGTGQPLPYFAVHLGSAITMNGMFVWHVFELPAPDPATKKEATVASEARTRIGV
jgi:hypothetical protein